MFSHFPPPLAGFVPSMFLLHKPLVYVVVIEPLGTIPISIQQQSPHEGGFIIVAGVGFEPTTFGL
ncbi:MAG: hypothetical protein HOB84_03585 [Candidatus Marinimicrobia bacterium]|jgi:hypothetical protein|nr:hypothetical protein [Candidatus Neomarinimicrobiota bacterium]MBT4713835.1 hypothetical protein [Candidatus Neomarinimicrobiota bacterium]MBT4944702.1 hypothetical protein [Candidatus Neomarinimicrobiota bacterium]MBT5268593.1 hypothetical protein [Candidatus Neomarinimicrobiota bacterium]